MKNYNEFIEGLQEDVEVPQEVWVKFESTLSELPEISTFKSKKKRWYVKAAASAAAILALGTGFCYINPVLAAKIPIIGKIFEQVEDDVTFSGNYRERKEVLTEEKEEAAEPVDTTYTVSDQGVELTASEIYCDGYSVFLTVKMKADAGGLTNIPAHYTSSFAETTAQGIYTEGNWKLQEEGTSEKLVNNNFEGKVLDDSTYIGMMKIDLSTVAIQDGVLELQLSQIGYDDLQELDKDDISASHKIDGSWELSIPFSVDSENAREIPVNQKTENGYGISKVFVSPYQLVVYTDIPYTTLSEEEFTREDFEAMWKEKTEGMEQVPEPPITYEEYLAERDYEYCEVAVFNQDKEALMPQDSNYSKFVFAVKDIDIDQIHIFLANQSGDMPLAKVTDMEAAKEKSVLEAEINIK